MIQVTSNGLYKELSYLFGKYSIYTSFYYCEANFCFLNNELKLLAFFSGFVFKVLLMFGSLHRYIHWIGRLRRTALLVHHKMEG